MPGQLVPHSFIGEDGLHPVLRVIEIAADGADAHVVSFLGRHLQLLHGADTVHRVKNQNFRMRGIPEAFQSRLTRIAGGGDQNDDFLPLSRLADRNPHEMRQNLQGHILEGAGGAVPQFQHVHTVLQFVKRSHGGRPEFSAGISRRAALLQFLLSEIRQEFRKDKRSALHVGLFYQARQIALGEGRELPGNKQPSLGGDPLRNRLGGRHLHLAVPGAVIHHFTDHSFPVKTVSFPLY